jgi:acetyl-CoA acetyltransferase
MPRIAIIDGIRTPFVKAWTDFWDIPGQELGSIVVRELLERTGLDPAKVDEVIFGAVAQPMEASNVARVISLLSGIPKEKRAYTVSRNCASGFESVTSSAEKISLGIDDIVIAGGTESMSNIPLFYRHDSAKIFLKMARAKSPLERLGWLLRFRPHHFLKPGVGLELGLTDPVCGLNMGQTVEILVKDYGITRMEQDEFALVSQKRAFNAREN